MPLGILADVRRPLVPMNVLDVRRRVEHQLELREDRLLDLLREHPHLVDDPIFGVYAVVMLAVMSVVMWTAFAAYHDPSLDRSQR